MGQKKFVDLNSLRRFKTKQDSANIAKFLGVGGTAVAANKVSNKLEIKNGSNTQQYDGSTPISIDITPPKIATDKETGIISVGDNIKVDNKGKISINDKSVVKALGETPVYRAEADSEGRNIINTYVEKESGKTLSSNDYTEADRKKLNDIEVGAQVNMIERISVNGELQQIYPRKEVRIEFPTKISKFDNDKHYVTPETDVAVMESKVAQKLKKPVQINGVDFDGTVDITVEDITKIPLSKMGKENGVATLDETGKVPSSQLPSYVDDVRVVSSANDFASLSSEDKKPDIIYITKDNQYTYRYSEELNDFIRVGANVSTSENALTANKLTKPVQINGVDFDGSKDIEIIHVAQSNIANAAKKLSSVVLINGVDFDGSSNITVKDNTKLPLTGGSIEGSLTVTDQVRAKSFAGDLFGNSTTAEHLSSQFEINGVVFDATKNIIITADPAEIASADEIRALFAKNT